MNVTGVLASIPNNVPTLSYFWYGSVGLADNTFEPFLEFDGNHFGFIFTPPNNDHGSMISISDQDWAIQSDEKMLLMENIINYLSSTVTGIEDPDLLPLIFCKIHPTHFMVRPKFPFR